MSDRLSIGMSLRIISSATMRTEWSLKDIITEKAKEELAKLRAKLEKKEQDEEGNNSQSA